MLVDLGMRPGGVALVVRLTGSIAGGVFRVLLTCLVALLLSLITFAGFFLAFNYRMLHSSMETNSQKRWD